MDVYTFRVAEAPWGAYGSILMNGMTSYLERLEGLLQLERTGPFIPPISFPGIGNIVVIDDFKTALERSGLSGLTFQPVTKARIVRLEWELWDQSKQDPEFYPESGEPEDYILERPHSPETAEQMGILWELRLAEHAVFRGRSEEPYSLWVLADWDGTDLFRAHSSGYNYASERAKDWLEKAVPGLLEFRPALLA